MIISTFSFVKGADSLLKGEEQLTREQFPQLQDNSIILSTCVVDFEFMNATNGGCVTKGFLHDQ